MTTTTTAADTYYQALAADYSSSEWAAQYEADMIAAEYQQWEAEQAATAAPVIQLYTDTLPAQPAAVRPFVDDLVQANDAIAATLSELNMLVLNTADAAFRSHLKKVAASLVAKAPLMEATKENYLAMLDAAEANAAFYYGRPVATDNTPAATVKPVVTLPAGVTPYKRKYSTATEISWHLTTASSLKEVASLYYVNAELIEQTGWLKQSFNDRKARLYRPSTAAA